MKLDGTLRILFNANFTNFSKTANGIKKTLYWGWKVRSDPISPFLYRIFFNFIHIYLKQFCPSDKSAIRVCLAPGVHKFSKTSSSHLNIVGSVLGTHKYYSPPYKISGHGDLPPGIYAFLSNTKVPSKNQNKFQLLANLRVTQTAYMGKVPV